MFLYNKTYLAINLGNKTQINADRVGTALKTNFCKNILINKNKCIKKMRHLC